MQCPFHLEALICHSGRNQADWAPLFRGIGGHLGDQYRSRGGHGGEELTSVVHPSRHAAPLSLVLWRAAVREPPWVWCISCTKLGLRASESPFQACVSRLFFSGATWNGAYITAALRCSRPGCEFCHHPQPCGLKGSWFPSHTSPKAQMRGLCWGLGGDWEPGHSLDHQLLSPLPSVPQALPLLLGCSCANSWPTGHQLDMMGGLEGEEITKWVHIQKDPSTTIKIVE